MHASRASINILVNIIIHIYIFITIIKCVRISRSLDSRSQADNIFQEILITKITTVVQQKGDENFVGLIVTLGLWRIVYLIGTAIMLIFSSPFATYLKSK